MDSSSNDTQPALTIEWRCISRSPQAKLADLDESFSTREDAEAWAADERATYPHHLVWIESRYVTPWAIVAPPMTRNEADRVAS